MTKTKRVYRDYKEILQEHLQDPLEAASYLRAALADDDERVFLLALRDVLEARGGNIPHLAEVTNLNKQNLYRMLSPNGNPRLSSLKTVLHAIGFEMSIEQVKK